MRRALEADDRMMVKAIARSAHTRGWAEVAAGAAPRARRPCAAGTVGRMRLFPCVSIKLTGAGHSRGEHRRSTAVVFEGTARLAAGCASTGGVRTTFNRLEPTRNAPSTAVQLEAAALSEEQAPASPEETSESPRKRRLESADSCSDLHRPRRRERVTAAPREPGQRREDDALQPARRKRALYLVLELLREQGQV
jgi:hypothetical protein